MLVKREETDKYRGKDISFVQPKIVTRKEFLDTVKIALELTTLKNGATADASVSVLH